MGRSGTFVIAIGAAVPADHVNSAARQRVSTGCSCSCCRPEPDWNGNRAQRRAAKKAGLMKPKMIDKE